MGKRLKRTSYTQSFYHQPGPKHLQSIILSVAKEKKAKKVLDVGCGSGWLVTTFRKNGIEAYGCDKSPFAVKKNLIVRSEATSLPYPKNSFDMVTAISLIEHLNPKDTIKFLSEIRRVLKPKGYLFLTTPNYASPLRLIQRGKWHGYLDSTHINFYTPLRMKSQLTKNGFQNTKFTFTSPPPEDFDWIAPFLPKNPPKNIRKALNFLATSTIISLLRNSFSVLAQNTK